MSLKKIYNPKKATLTGKLKQPAQNGGLKNFTTDNALTNTNSFIGTK
jgi:hypothetical protein